MKKLNEHFSTPKKAVFSIVCIVVILLVIGGVIVIAANVIADKTFIGKKEAKRIALADAGISSSEVSKCWTELDYEHGSFEYEVEFYSNGNEYDYRINAISGAIISRDIDYNESRENKQSSKGENSIKTDSDSTVTNPVTPNAPDSNQTGAISTDEAKAVALKDAGLTETDVTFTKTKFDKKGSASVYEIEFYSPQAEYEYEIDATDGTIVSMDMKKYNVQTGNNNSNTGNSDKYIGVDQAKAIAVNHAGISGEEAVFSKAKLENDDGKEVYDIEFYYGKSEYDYTIDAVSGEIIEYDFEQLR